MNEFHKMTVNVNKESSVVIILKDNENQSITINGIDISKMFDLKDININISSSEIVSVHSINSNINIVK